MRIIGVVILAFALLGVSMAAEQATRKAATPHLLWEVAVSGEILSASLAPGGACGVAVTGTDVVVVDRDGVVRWQRELLEMDRNASRAVTAVSPTCDWVAAWLHTASGGVQVLHRNTGRVIALDRISTYDLWTQPTLRTSPDGKLLAIGANLNQLLLVASDGVVIKRISVSDDDDGVKVAFTSDSRRVVITGRWHIGVANISGEWVWRRDVELREIYPNNDATQAAIAQDGGFAAFVGSTNQDMPPETWIVDGKGRVIATRRGSGSETLVGISGRCLLFRRAISQSETDLILRDRRLAEIVRIRGAPNGALSAEDVTHQNGVMLDYPGPTLRAYELPPC